MKYTAKESIRQRTKIGLYLLGATIFLILSGCGGGGGSSSSPGPNQTIDPAKHLPDLSKYSGKLYYHSYFNNGFSSYNFQDGSETLILHEDEFKETRVFISDDSVWLGYHPNSMETVRIRNLVDPAQSYDINLYPYESNGPPLLSPDGKMLLQPEKSAGVSWRLRVREGNQALFNLPLQDLNQLTSGGFDDWAWIDNDTAMFTSDSFLFIVPDVRVQHYEKLHDFAPYTGIGYVRISKDYTKLAYNKGKDLYIMDVNTEVERKLTANSDAKKSVIRNFAWSPDGKHIAFIIGEYRWLGGTDLAAGFCPTLHIIPTDLSEPVPINYDVIPDPDKVVTLQSMYGSKREVRNVCVDGHFLSWNP